MNLWPVEHFFQLPYMSSKLDSPLIKTLEMDSLILMINMLKKVFNWSEVHFSEMTCYKIHTLIKIFCHMNNNLKLHKIGSVLTKSDLAIHFFWNFASKTTISIQLECQRFETSDFCTDCNPEAKFKHCVLSENERAHRTAVSQTK